MSCALLFLSGCAGLSRQEEFPLQEVTAEQLVQLLREREEAIQTMKGLFRAQVKGPGIFFAQRVEGAMFYRRAGGLRLKGFNQVGGQLFDFALADDLYRLRLPGQPVVTGRVGDLERMERVGRPLQLSLLAMGGAVGIASVAEGEEVLLTEEGDRYRLYVFSSAARDLSGTSRPTRRLWFDRRSLEVVQEDRLTETGAVETTITLEDFRPVSLPVKAGGADTILKPFKIISQDGQGEGTLQVTFHEIIPNQELKPEELGVVFGENGHGRRSSREAPGS
ncbi:MAG: hypothetical protein FJ249_05800 [Nitrospira sp.]|nr:hypothetical protein [Nitrospira sp.]